MRISDWSSDVCSSDLHRGEAFDRDGAFAAQGRGDDTLLARLLAEPWFALPPPKSTGRDQFHLGWVESRLRGDEAPQDVQATLLALTVRTVAEIGRASCRERECTYVSITAVALSLNTKTSTKSITTSQTN